MLHFLWFGVGLLTGILLLHVLRESACRSGEGVVRLSLKLAKVRRWMAVLSVTAFAPEVAGRTESVLMNQSVEVPQNFRSS